MTKVKVSTHHSDDGKSCPDLFYRHCHLHRMYIDYREVFFCEFMNLCNIILTLCAHVCYTSTWRIKYHIGTCIPIYNIIYRVYACAVFFPVEFPPLGIAILIRKTQWALSPRLCSALSPGRR